MPRYHTVPPDPPPEPPRHPMSVLTSRLQAQGFMVRLDTRPSPHRADPRDDMSCQVSIWDEVTRMMLAMTEIPGREFRDAPRSDDRIFQAIAGMCLSLKIDVPGLGVDANWEPS
jgi:hypothetical protein